MTWQLALALSGLAQLGLAAGSLAIPGILGWREETGRLTPLTRSVFWTYAAYIWCTHLAFAALSLLAPELLLEQRPLAAAVNGFIATWWGARLLIQFAAFDRSGMSARSAETCRPPRRERDEEPVRCPMSCRPAERTLAMVLGEEALVLVFLACTSLHGALCLRGLLG